MKNYVITIGRECASGGKTIGKMIAQRLGIEYYDAALLRDKAKEDGIEDGIFDMFDEQPTRSFLFSVVMDPYAIDSAINEGKVIEAQRKVICDAAEKAPCVIVGRRADKILQENHNVISIFISADDDDRIAKVAKSKDITEKAARKYIERKDRERASYYNYFGDGKWGKASNYSMCFNTSQLSEDTVANIVCEYIKNND